MRRIVSFLFFVLAFSFVPVPKVFANENFESHYDVRYTVSQSGKTSANFAISLINTSSEFYASSYKINLTFDDITNVKVADRLGKITPDIQKGNSGYSIDIPFNERVVGIGKSDQFTVSFDTNDIAQHEGEIWEINVPGLVNQEAFDSFTVAVVVPPSFGKPTYIKPSQHSDILIFSKEQLGKSGISIGFGQKQTYTFQLTYHLKNQNIFPVRTEIAIPPTTNYQEVYLDNVDPRPVNITQDADGNWLAHYDLSSKEEIDVTVKGNAMLFLHPKKTLLSEEDRRTYTKAKPYWQTSDGQIQKIAAKLRTPAAIYGYVMHALTYDIDRVSAKKTRAGAVNVLKTPTSAVCLEFTDLFVALARATGIPAREVDGFAYTQNSKQRPLSLLADILHAWPEYYDTEKQTWVMVDPTWGNTTGGVDYFETLDFDHFVFVVKGTSSEYPIPAGGYKFLKDLDKKDVIVSFAQKNDIQSPITVSLVPQFPKTVTAGVSVKGNVLIQNIGTRVIAPQEVIVKTMYLSPNEQKVPVPAIPPFGFITVDVAFKTTSILTNTQDRLTIAYAGKTITDEMKIIPFFLVPWVIGGGVILAVSSVIIYIVIRKTWRLSIFRQRQENSLRGEGQES